MVCTRCCVLAVRPAGRRELHLVGRVRHEPGFEVGADGCLGEPGRADAGIDDPADPIRGWAGGGREGEERVAVDVETGDAVVGAVDRTERDGEHCAGRRGCRHGAVDLLHDHRFGVRCDVR